MTNTTPTFEGWYPDEETGGTKFWDGHQWTGDTRPPRKKFAAQAAHRGWGIGLFLFGVISLFGRTSQFISGEMALESDQDPVVSLISSVFLCGLFIAWGIYLYRGQGPTTRAVRERLRRDEVWRKEQLREEMMRAPYYVPEPPDPQPAAVPEINVSTRDAASATVTAAQIEALANPETAKALENLQKLLYTRVLTPEEFQRAKNKLLGDN